MARYQRVPRGRDETMYEGTLLGLGHRHHNDDCRDAGDTRWRPLRAGGSARDPAAAAAGTTVVASAHCHPRVCSLVAALFRARRFHSRISTDGRRHALPKNNVSLGRMLVEKLVVTTITITTTMIQSELMTFTRRVAGKIPLVLGEPRNLSYCSRRLYQFYFSDRSSLELSTYRYLLKRLFLSFFLASL